MNMQNSNEEEKKEIGANKDGEKRQEYFQSINHRTLGQSYGNY